MDLPKLQVTSSELKRCESEKQPSMRSDRYKALTAYVVPNSGTKIQSDTKYTIPAQFQVTDTMAAQHICRANMPDWVHSGK